MQSTCSSKYPPIVLPGAYSACMDAAEKYYGAVTAWQYAEDPLPGLQQLALDESRNYVEPLVDATSCGTTPGRTTLYDTSLITLIDKTWQDRAGRQPTIFEFLDV